MSAGPGPGGGAWGGGHPAYPAYPGPSGYNGFAFELPPLEDWSHLPPEELLQKLTEWRDQKRAEAAAAAQYFHAPPSQFQSQPQSQPQLQPQSQPQHHSLPPRPQVAQPGGAVVQFAPPENGPRRIDARNRPPAPPPPTVYHPTHHEVTTPQPLNPADTNPSINTNTANTSAPPEVARNERESSFEQDYTRWESEVVQGRPAIPTDYALVPRTPAPGPPLGLLYVSAFESTQQPAPSVGVQANGSLANRSQPVAVQATAPASTAVPSIQNLSISNPSSGSGPTAAIESSSVNPQPAATAAAEPHPEVGISDIQEISFPHLEDLEFQPLTAPVRGPATKEDHAPPSSSTEATEAVSSKTAKNRAKRAKQKVREKAKKAAAAAAAPAIVVDSDDSSTAGPVNETPASPEEASSPEEVAAPVTKAKAKKARKKAKRAAAVAAEAEENEFLNKMKEDSKSPISRVVEGS